MKIYTKTGDRGETDLVGGIRVSKADSRVDAYGEVDELNAALGVARAAGVDPEISGILAGVQRDLFALGARLADPADRLAGKAPKTALGAADVERLERWIDRLDAELPRLGHFILAGGTPAGAALHLARAVCRRAERRIVSISGTEGRGVLEPELLAYVNRLSDFLFVLARIVNHRAGVAEIEW